MKSKYKKLSIRNAFEFSVFLQFQEELSGSYIKIDTPKKQQSRTEIGKNKHWTVMFMQVGKNRCRIYTVRKQQ